MLRFNSEGIPRDQLAYALTRSDYVAFARKLDRCMLCCRVKVNEAGVCDYCWSLLTEKELQLAERWTGGV